MGKMIMLFCLFSGSETDFFAMPFADLTSFDVISAGTGIGYYPEIFLNPPPTISASLGRIKGYWGDRIAFVGGAEMLNVRLALGLIEMGPHGSVALMPVPFGEAFTIHAGIAWLGETRPLFRKSKKDIKEKYFKPRVELLTGIAPISSVECRVIMSELNLLIRRCFGMEFEHRYYLSQDIHAPYGTFDLSVYITLGRDKFDVTAEKNQKDH